MRIVFVIIVGLTLLFVITVSWYVGNAIVSGMLLAFYELLTATEASENVTNIVAFLNIVWGPILDIMVILWMIASAQQIDVESALYG